MISDNNVGCGESRDEDGLKKDQNFLWAIEWGRVVELKVEDGCVVGLVTGPGDLWLLSAYEQFERYWTSANIFEISSFSNLKVIVGKCCRKVAGCMFGTPSSCFVKHIQSATSIYLEEQPYQTPPEKDIAIVAF